MNECYNLHTYEILLMITFASAYFIQMIEGQLRFCAFEEFTWKFNVLPKNNLGG